MNIGIFIKKPENIFSNGCIQQTYFLKKLFQNTGHHVDFLSIEAHYTHFELTDEPIIFTDNHYDFSRYDCVILGSLVLLPKTNGPFIDNLRSYTDVSIINLVCGNVFVLHQEEFVFETHKIIDHYKQDYFTENWMLEMYDYAHNYLEMLSGVPTTITPYVWDTDILDKYIETNPQLNFDKEESHEKINLLLFEPNMSVHKNSMIPLLICDEYYKRHKGRLNKVYVFCGDKVIQKNQEFVNKLDIYKDNKLETYGRIIMPYIVDVIKKNNDFLNVVVSYNLLNNLNFLHLEMFHLGIPIIHNCEPFRQNGLYFSDFAFYKAVELVEHTRVSFDKPKYKALCEDILLEYSPSNTQRVERYASLFSKHKKKTSNTPHESTPITEPEQDETLDYIDSNIFYQGSGYVIFLSNTDEIPKLRKCLEIIADTREIAYVEVFVKEGIAPFQLETTFSEHITVHAFHHTTCNTINDAIKYSSFQEVKFVDINHFVLTDDVKVYTK